MIVVVPLLLLSGFGGVQIADEVQRASRSAALAEQISVLPAIMRYATSIGAIVGVSEFNLAVDENNAILDDYTAPVEELANRGDLDPVVSREIERTLSEGQELARAATNRGTAAAARIEQVRTFDNQIQRTVRALVEQTENATAFAEAGHLLDLWHARLMPFDQAIAFTQPISDSEPAVQLLETAFASERAAISTLRGTTEDQQALAEMLAATERRQRLLLSSASLETRTPDLAAMVLTSVEAGDQLMDASIERIVAELNNERDEAEATAIRTAVFVAIAIVCAVAITLILAGLLVSSLRRLRDDTTRAAYHDLPQAVAAIRADTAADTVSIAPIGVDTVEEIGQVARAVDGVNAQALLLASEQAALRRQITTMLEALARRNRSLVDRQLALIENLEYHERDPQRLQSLFELDHLASRMRRTGESLLVLAGTRKRHASRTATPLEDVMRASISQVENYERVRLGVVFPVSLIGGVVDDLIHLLTELLDNSLRASDPGSSVSFLVSRAEDKGLLLEIIDTGIGIPPAELDQINRRLIEGAETDAHATRHMGLYVVGRVAQRHRLQVRLRPTFEAGAPQGITASIYIPGQLLTGSGIEMTWNTVERPRRLSNPDLTDAGPHVTP